MSAVRHKLLPMLAFPKSNTQDIHANNSLAKRTRGHFIYIALAHALSEGQETRGSPGFL